tara:strand:+ start:803 stop:1372 length:570 start_codon:yes stop_codon:yes gene_type:complete
MTQRIDRQGTFQGRVIDYGVKKAKSGAVAVTVHAEIDAALIGDDWEDWSEFEFDAFGDLWVVGKTGEVLEWTARDLCEHAGWDGDLESISSGTWEPPAVVFHVQPNEYEGIVRYRLSRIVDPEKPNRGTIAGLDGDEVKALQAEHGAALRACVGDLVEEPAAAKPKRKRKKATTVPPDGGPTSTDEIPF